MTEPMPIVSISTLRRKTATLLKQAEDGPILITGYGKPAFVLMSMEHYEGISGTASNQDVTERTYFGLEIVNGRGVRPADIAGLPFADFWSDSATYSSQIKDEASDQWLVHLTDWENFAKMFFTTGRHRNMQRSSEVPWFDRDEDEPERTYFGLEVVDQKYVRRIDIARLPFYEFWLEENGKSEETVISMLVDLEDWQCFVKRFIKTG